MLPSNCEAHKADVAAILTDVFAVDSMMEMGLFGRFKPVSHLLRHLAGEFHERWASVPNAHLVTDSFGCDEPVRK